MGGKILTCCISNRNYNHESDFSQSGDKENLDEREYVRGVSKRKRKSSYISTPLSVISLPTTDTSSNNKKNKNHFSAAEINKKLNKKYTNEELNCFDKTENNLILNKQNKGYYAGKRMYQKDFENEK
jgi:hypothetical protein